MICVTFRFSKMMFCGGDPCFYHDFLMGIDASSNQSAASGAKSPESHHPFLAKKSNTDPALKECKNNIKKTTYKWRPRPMPKINIKKNLLTSAGTLTPFLNSSYCKTLNININILINVTTPSIISAYLYRFQIEINAIIKENNIRT